MAKTLENQQNNYAYIDGANLHRGIAELGWKLDYKRFRIYLREKYAVNRAYIFLGFVSTNTNLYRDLQNWDYAIVFKPTIPDKEGEIKGNCDAELVLQAVVDMYEMLYENAIVLLRRAVPNNIVFLERLKDRLSYNKSVENEKAPLRDETRKGAFS